MSRRNADRRVAQLTIEGSVVRGWVPLLRYDPQSLLALVTGGGERRVMSLGYDFDAEPILHGRYWLLGGRVPPDCDAMDFRLDDGARLDAAARCRGGWLLAIPADSTRGIEHIWLAEGQIQERNRYEDISYFFSSGWVPYGPRSE